MLACRKFAKQTSLLNNFVIDSWILKADGLTANIQ